jgi:uncharacterized repeat protein (TIGR01451 family)
MKTALTFATILFVSLFLIKTGVAGYYQPPTPSINIVIDKLVSMPGTTKGGETEFVDNLSPSDPRFAPGDTIVFKLKVQNTSDTELNDVTVSDFLPGSVTFVDGDGELNDEGDVVINAGTFGAGEVKEFTINVRARAQNELPADQGLVCEINRGHVQADEAEDDDTAQFCIEKQVIGVPGAPERVPAVPQAGPQMGILLIGSQLGLLGTGIYLRRKSS